MSSSESDFSSSSTESSSSSESVNSSSSELSEQSSSSSYYEALYSPHPYSYVVRQELTWKDSWCLAAVLIDLRLTDQAFIQKFGPIKVDFGGTYGSTFIPQDLRRIVDELRVVKSFKVCYGATDAYVKTEQEALLWQNTISDRIDQAIWATRNRRLGLQGNPEAYDTI